MSNGPRLAADPAEPTAKHAVLIPETLWEDFTAWCRHQRVTLHQPAPHAPGQIPRYEALRTGASPGGELGTRRRARSRPRSDTVLTDRETEVLRLMSEGLTNRAIGQKLFLSEDTVKSHTRRIYRKLGIGERGGAVGEGFRRGLLHLPLDPIPGQGVQRSGS